MINLDGSINTKLINLIENKEFIVFGIKMVIYGKKDSLEMINVMGIIKSGHIKDNYS